MRAVFVGVVEYLSDEDTRGYFEDHAVISICKTDFVDIPVAAEKICQDSAKDAGTLQKRIE